MPRTLKIMLLLLSLVPIHRGCGNNEPMTPETNADPVEELDPASEAEVVNEARRDT